MNASILDPDDPRLTAYALGELPVGADRAEIERLLAESPEARAAVEEIRSLAAALVAEYETERAQQSNGHAADGNADAGAPRTVIAFPVPGNRQARWWNHPALKIAAVLLVLGVLGAYLLLPIGNKAQGSARHYAATSQPAPPVSVVTAPPAELAKALSTSSGHAMPAATASPDGLLAFDKKAAEPFGVAPSTKEPSAADAPALTLYDEFAMLAPKDTASSQDAREPAARTVRREIANAPGSPPAQEQQQAPMVSTESAGKMPVPAAGPVARVVTATGRGGAVTANSAPRPFMADVSRSFKTPVLKREAQSPTNFYAQSSAAPPTAAHGPVPLAASAKRAPSAAEPRSAGDNGAVTDSLSSSVAASNTQTESMPVAQLAPKKEDAAAFAGSLGDSSKQLEGADQDHSFNTAAYDHIAETPFLSAKENPLSTFSIDVDTASYSNVRRFIESSSLPPKDAVRIEEMLNYFPYAYAPPQEGDPHPFALHLEAAACPWNLEHRLVRIGIKGREIAPDKRPASNFVFLIDVSGSMSPRDRLPLIKESLRLLTERLTENDHVAIVVYAGNSGLALPSTSGDQKEKILNALGRLEAGGSTNGADGIQLAYKVAREHLIKGGVNRVILATDGDFNVGVTSQGELVRLIEKEAKSGIFLSALGVGNDNYKDSTMQKLADRGNGNYAYIDRLEEGKKVLVEQMTGTLVTIAKDVKIQVEFNPAAVASYRLIGYEKRMLRKEDFNDDKVDAGEIGAGHSVTALYEIVPAGQADTEPARAVDALKYQSPAPAAAPAASAGLARGSEELLTLKMRYKAPDADKSERAYEQPLVDHPEPGDFAKASPDFKFAASVAGFGLVLRDSPFKGNLTLGAVVELAQDGKGPDASGYRSQFIDLVRRAQALSDRANAGK